MKRMGIKLAAVLFVLLACGITGCSKKDGQNGGEDKIEKEINDGTEKTHKWPQSNGVICVLFGYGFNDENFYSQVSEALASKYGLESDGGLIWPVLFPDDFDKGGAGRISELYDFVTEKKVKGILLLGAPENTNAAIAHLQDNNGGKLSYPIFSFFPQDDVLGMESTCDFVLDYERSAKEEENNEETTQQIDKSIEQIILNAVRYMSDHPTPLVQDAKLHDKVQQIVGKNKKVRRFVDSETGLQSFNHFVIERDEKVATVSDAAKSTPAATGSDDAALSDEEALLAGEEKTSETKGKSSAKTNSKKDTKKK